MKNRISRKGVLMERERFKLDYEGKLPQIESNTLINSLLHVTAAIQEINAELNKESNIKTTLQIKINAFSPGSFFVDLELLRDISKDLLPAAAFVGGHIDINTIIKVLIEFIKLKLFLKGKKPEKIEKSGDEVTITGSNGNTTVVNIRTFNHYTGNVIINEEVSKNFETLREDAAIDAFKLTDKNDKPLVGVDKKDFGILTSRNELLEEQIKTLPVSNADLYILKVVFEEGRKWDFYYQGNKISAAMDDKAFAERINSGEKFAKGDALVCNLEIEQVFNTDVNTYVNKSYRVLKVLDHKPRPEQGELLPPT